MHHILRTESSATLWPLKTPVKRNRYSTLHITLLLVNLIMQYYCLKSRLFILLNFLDLYKKQPCSEKTIKKLMNGIFFFTFLTFLILSESTVSFYVVSYLSVSNERLIFMANETSGKCFFDLIFLFWGVFFIPTLANCILFYLHMFIST